MGVDHDGAPSGAIEEETGDEDQRPFLKNGRDSNDAVIAVPPVSFGYNAGHRPYRDVAFSVAFVVFVTASLAIGVFAAFNHNPDYHWVESASYDHSEGCTLPEVSSSDVAKSNSEGFGEKASRGLVNVRSLLELDAQSDMIAKVALYVLVATFILSVPMAFFLLWVLRKYTKELVYITLPICFLSQVAFTVTLIVTCTMSESCKSDFNPTSRYLAFGLAIASNVLFVWVLFRNWDRIELSIRIIRTASEALNKNLGLLLVLPGLDLVYCLYLIPAGVFLFFAYTNGTIVTNPELVQDPDLICGGSSNRPCCVWETDGWVPAYLAMTGFVILWGILVVNDIRVFTISGTVSQWYFATTLSSTVGTTKRALRHALGPSFGTLCFSGLIVAFVKTIRSAMESSRSNRGEVGCVALLVRACLECLISAVEFLTKFTTNFAAITGEGFCSSAVMTFNLLKRNFLSTMVVETVAGRLLGQAVFVFAAVYGLLVYGGQILFVEHGKHLWSPDAFFLSIAASVVLLVVLVYFVQVLHSVVDTVYICYAMDKDHDEVSQPEVHDVYVLLPAADDGTASLAVPRSARRNSEN